MHFGIKNGSSKKSPKILSHSGRKCEFSTFSYQFESAQHFGIRRRGTLEVTFTYPIEQPDKHVGLWRNFSISVSYCTIVFSSCTNCLKSFFFLFRQKFSNGIGLKVQRVQEIVFPNITAPNSPFSLTTSILEIYFPSIIKRLQAHDSLILNPVIFLFALGIYLW